MKFFSLIFMISCLGLNAKAQSVPAVHTLSNGVLSVEVMDPNSPERYYQGIRFSPVGNVLQVTMDGRKFLHAPEKHNPLTDAAGLPIEFDISPSTPPGFDEAAEGEGFVKVGVGVLARTGDIYRFFTPYQTLSLAKTDVEWGKDSAIFRQSCEGANGYAYDLACELRLAGRKLEVRCRLKNAGTKPFTTEQYAHDFFAFGGQPVGRGYELELSYDFEAKFDKPVFESSGRVVKLIAPIVPPMKAAEARITALDDKRGADRGGIRDPATGQSVKTAISRPAARLTLHVGPNYFCPEQFVRIPVAPGETQEWTRTYEFEIKDQTK